MQSEQLYTQILGITAPWSVTRVDLDLEGNKVDVHVSLAADEPSRCPVCAAICPRHDTRVRRWRHLDTCQMQTVLIAEVPRASCPTHGVKQMSVPWAEETSRLTAMFEALVITRLKQAST